MSKVQHQRWIKRLIFMLALIFLPLLTGLGFWQLDRAGQKQVLLQQWQSAPELEYLPEIEVATVGSRLALEGLFESDRYYLLDNRTRGGRVGYEVIGVFFPDHHGHTLLVNLGWVEGSASRAELPEVTLPGEWVQLQGRLVQPSEPLLLARDHWPENRVVRIQQVDMARMSASHPQLYPLLLQLDQPLVSGLELGWSIVNISPERHLGYAVQWFGLALVLLSGCLIMFFYGKGRRVI